MVALDRKVQKFGSAFYIGIPSPIVKRLDIKQKDILRIDEKDGKIVMERA